MKPYYERAGITIYHGDCREILPQMERHDLLLTDPPYGIKRFTRGFGTTRFRGHGCEKSGIIWDKKPAPEVFELLLASAQMAIIWGSNNFQLPPSEYFLVWDKAQTVDNFASAELAYTNIKIPAKIFRFSIHQHNQIVKSHPTEKPLGLMKWCIGLAGNIQSVLDPFMGSGTTLVAAKNIGAEATGIEMEERYCEIAANRLGQEVFSFAEENKCALVS